MADIKDKLVLAVNEFKKSLDGQTIPIHGKNYATVALRVGVARRVLGTALDIVTKIVSIDANTVVMQADVYVDGQHVSTGHAEEKSVPKLHRVKINSWRNRRFFSACRSALRLVSAIGINGGGGKHFCEQRLDQARAAVWTTYSVVQCSGWFNLYTVLGWGSFLCERGAGNGALFGHTGERRWPGAGQRLPEPRLRILVYQSFYSRGVGRRQLRTKALTARFGRDSAAVGQGARVRSRRRAEEARPDRATRGRPQPVWGLLF